MISATYYVLYNFFCIIGAEYYFHVRELQAHLELFESSLRVWIFLFLLSSMPLAMKCDISIATQVSLLVCNNMA